MPNNKVKNTDTQIIDVLQDIPGSIQHDRLVNSRSPVAIEQSGTPKGQSDILNFILPSGSSIAPSGGKIDISVSGVSDKFIFRPGEPTPAGNVYSSFSTLYAALLLVDGPTEILFDNSLAAVSIPAGTYDFSNTLLSRFSKEYAPIGGSSLIVNLPIGTEFTGERLFVSGIRLRSLDTDYVFEMSGTGGLVILQDGAQLEAAGADAFIYKLSGGTPGRIYMDKSHFIESSFPVIETGGGSAVVDIYLFNGSILEQNTLGNTVGDTTNLHIRSADSDYTAAQSGIAGTLDIILEEYSESIYFDNTIEGILVAENVQSAIDELSTLIGGGSGFQNEFIFRPSGVASGNIYTSFALLYAALILVDGPKVIYFDNSLGTITIPSGSYDFSDTVLSKYKRDYSTFSVGPDNTPVNLADGVIITGERLIVHGVRLVSLSSAPVFTMSIAGGLVILMEGAELRAPGTASFMFKDSVSAFPARIFIDKSKITSSANSIILTDGGSAVVDIYLFNGAVLEYDTLENLNVADIFNVYLRSADADFDPSQSYITGTLNVSLDEKSKNIYFDPTIESVLTAGNVQDAIDELSLLIGGGGLVPRKETVTVTFNGQTVFSLSFTPNVLSKSLLTLNGVEMEETVSYTTGPGVTLTWLDVPFTLETTDVLIIHYFT